MKNIKEGKSPKEVKQKKQVKPKKVEEISESINVWDKSIEVESNFYNWDGAPIITLSKEQSKNT